MHDWESLSHVRCDCKYHLVIPFGICPEIQTKETLLPPSGGLPEATRSAGGVPLSVLVVALFVLSFAGAAVSQEAKGTEVTKVAGALSAVNPDTGKVRVIERESGKTVTLTAGSDVALKDFGVSDQVVVEYTPRDMVIRSITKQ